MYPKIKGPTPWVVMLCQFSDVPVPQRPTSYYRDFLSSDKLGLFGYWRDVSYGTIELSESTVAGWFPMSYKYRTDWWHPRSAWVKEAIDLAGKHGIDLFQYYGVLAVINGPADDSAIGLVAETIGGRTRMFGEFVLNTAESFGQGNWRWCRRCQGLFFADDKTSYCPADRAGVLRTGHDGTQSDPVVLSYVVEAGGIDISVGLPDPVQDNWRWCSNCQGLFYGGNADLGICPYNQKAHVPIPGGFSYRLAHDVPAMKGEDGNVRGFGNSGWYWCSKCQGLFTGGKLAGICPKDWRVHDAQTHGSFNYSLLYDYSHVVDQMGGHEMGHCLGLEHAFDTSSQGCGGSGRPGEYCDKWDIMGSSYGFSTGGPYDPAGESPCAPTLYKLGFLSEDRVLTCSPDIASISLAALSRPDVPGYQMAKVITSDLIYTIEFRQRTGWDGGVPSDGVLIHELRTRYTLGQQHWRWCTKCNGLYYAGQAVCPAGGVHAHTVSRNYSLVMNSAVYKDQNNWRWCSKCQSLAFYDGSRKPGVCPAGGWHDHSASSNYTVEHDPSDPRDWQSGWRHCTKCEGLGYSGNLFPGTCPAGSNHALGSGFNYSFPFGAALAGIIVGLDPGASIQDNWCWCYKCQSLAYAGLFPCPAGGLHEDTGSFDYSLSFSGPGASGQNGWKWCRKCQGLFYGGAGRTGACAAGGAHDGSASGDYTLIQNVATTLEQNNWWHCQQCEGLFYYNGTGQPGPCPFSIGGFSGQHSNTGSSNYSLASFQSERIYLHPAAKASWWQVGEIFIDLEREVKITVVSIDSTNSVAIIDLAR